MAKCPCRNEKNDSESPTRLKRQRQGRAFCKPKQQWRCFFGHRMNMKYQLNALAAVFLIQISCAAYAGEMNDCPSSLRVAQTVQGGKGNWQPFDSDENHPFVGVSFSDGPPNLKVILAPDREQKTKLAFLLYGTSCRQKMGIGCLVFMQKPARRSHGNCLLPLDHARSNMTKNFRPLLQKHGDASDFK